MLRTKAIRFSNAQKTLSRNDPALLQSVSTLRMPMGQRNVHPCILPGTPYALYLSEDRTGDCLNLHAIHVISMATGYVHDTCRLQAASVRNMDVYHSATYGMVVVLKYFARQGTHMSVRVLPRGITLLMPLVTASAKDMPCSCCKC
jgi:hypothetical protein